MDGTIEAGFTSHALAPEAEAAVLADRTFQGRRLSRTLVVGDAITVGLAYAVVATVATFVSSAAAASLMVPPIAAVLGVLAIRSLGVSIASRIAIRSTELAGLARAAALTGAGVLLADRVLGLYVSVALATAATVVTWLALVAWRSLYRSWLSMERSAGRYVQRTLVVGTGREAMEIVSLAEIHPEAGSLVVGIVGDRDEADQADRGGLWLGEIADLAAIIAATAVARIAICSADVAPATVVDLIRAERDGGAEVIIHAGLSGVAAKRVTVSAFAHEAVLHVEPATPSRLALAVKRLFDIVVAGSILLVASPVLALIALRIKREDGGPVLFRQQRVGRHEAEFAMLKFRTMVVDAEARLAAMQRDNQRTGPLFKLARDPRITKVGDVLRRTSLDELPQLINVLKGDMSLIGPRPALRREVDEFPADLHARHRVRPGITGLWQVEARDNPAFGAYHRLDLHYVENWSLTLDLVVLLSTVEHLAMRPFASRTRGEMTAAVAGGVTTSDAPGFATAA
jgi:exopolysaccharide biosynthesis polyprenyl glycosylphosphotransferase